MKQETVSSVAEIAGSTAIVVGASLASIAAGLIAAGAFALLFSWRLTR